MQKIRTFPRICLEGWDIPPDASVRYHYFRRGKSLCGKYLRDHLRDPEEQPNERFCCRECLKRKRREA